MADAKISQLTDGGAIQATDEVPVNRGGVNYKVNVGAAGSDTQVQFNNSGSFGGSASLTWNNGLTIAAPLATAKPLIIKGAASQTANLQEWQNSTGTIVASVGAPTELYGTNAFYIGNNSGASIMGATGDGRAFVGARAIFGTVMEINNLGANTFATLLVLRNSTSNMQFTPSQIVTTSANFSFGANAQGSAINMVAPSNFALNVRDSRVQINASGDLGNSQFAVSCGLATRAVSAFRGAASQTASIMEWQTNTGAALSFIRADGSLKPASLADIDAANDSIYYSTTAGKLVYKDSTGTVNSLY